MADEPLHNRPYVSKKLIVCCDGTWRDSGSGIFTGTGLSWIWRGEAQVATNVTKISRAVQSTDSQGRQQIVYYQAGVGSSGNIIQRLLGGALGVGLSDNIREAYSFIANNYLPGDEIFLVGFSRGAFTARAIGGMIGDLGLLTTEGQEHLPDIHEDWENAGSAGYKTLLGTNEPNFIVKVGVQDPKIYVKSYREGLLQLEYTRPDTIPIKAIGVFETVGSLGVPVNPFFQRFGLPVVLRAYRFYNTDLGGNVENAFQALALDEARGAYRPALWQKQPEVNANLKQTWFPGVHSDVGGGHPDSGLSNISLAWMMSHLAPFIDFTSDFVPKQHKKNQKYLAQKHVPATGLKWAGSQLANSSSGLHALLGVAVRAPGRYFALNKKTLAINETEPLQNTNEYIHVSVRSRGVTGGLDEHNKMAKYAPKALSRENPRDYRLNYLDAEPGKASWTYIGNDQPFHNVTLSEDVLGVYEKELFQNYVTKQS